MAPEDRLGGCGLAEAWLADDEHVGVGERCSVEVAAVHLEGVEEPSGTASGDVDAEERAALALTESVIRLSKTHAPEAVVAEALKVLGEQQTAAVLGLILSINAWNQVGVTLKAMPK